MSQLKPIEVSGSKSVEEVEEIDEVEEVET